MIFGFPVMGMVLDSLTVAQSLCLIVCRMLRGHGQRLTFTRATMDRFTAKGHQMAYFNRFDICGAYLALENDWNVGGWLHERPSNRRRLESTGIQLARIGFKPFGDSCCAFEYLRNDNQRDIYVEALHRFGLKLDPSDDAHAAILQWVSHGWVAHGPTDSADE
jgi:hypothetical protein